jgi:glutathione S-transferase
MDIKLYDWGPSPFCLKIRSILDYKGLAYRRIPALSAYRQFARRSPVRKVPALDVDGTLTLDSTDIAYTLERLAPNPAIIPTAPRDRALCHTLEEWADESLYFVGLYYQWLDPEGAPLVARAFASNLGTRLSLPFFRRRLHAQIVGQGTGRKPAAMIEADLRRHLDAARDLLLDTPFLLGPTPTLADFAVAAQLVYLSRPPASARILAEYPSLDTYLQRIKALRGTGEPST